MLCIYHSSDLDGQCSGAIVKYKYPECELFGINYGQKIPWDLIDKHNKIFLVDFSFQPIGSALRLIDSNKQLIWIDHHISAIKELFDYNIKGLQEVDKGGACELTWKFLFSDKRIPLAVKLLSQYDVWNHENEKTIPFQYGMRLRDTHPSNQKLWALLFKRYYSGLITNIIDQGKIISLYIEKENTISSKQSFKLDFEGYKCIALNKSGSSKMFDFVEDINKYDIKLTFVYKYDTWTITLYTSHNNIDVSKIASKYGGGGHKQAAGFQINKLPFNLTKSN